MLNRIVAVATLLALISMSAQAAPPKVAQSSDLGSQSLFGRNLVEKVKKGAVYISAMASQGGPLQEAWIGSGFIFQSNPEDNTAYVLTNHHVGQETAILQIETWDNSTYRGQLVATEPGIDVALVKVYDIPPDAYEANVMGDSDAVQIGEAALAIGAPGAAEGALTNRSDPFITFGLHQTTTMRVVMGKHSSPWEYIYSWSAPSWKALGHQIMTNCPYRFVSQSAINGGNSGGPLYNARGEVIGLNHAHFGAGAVITQNENYTIPINFARKFAYDILNNGKHEIPWFGMDIIFPSYYSDSQALSEWEERHYDPELIKILGVRRDSPAERAGLQEDDVIVQFDGLNFKTITDLRLYIFEMQIGKQVPVTVRRGRQKVELTLEVGVKRGYDSEFSM